MPAHSVLVAAPLVLAGATAAVGPSDGWATLVEALGTVGSLLLFLWGFHAEWWVTGRVYRRRVEELNEAVEKLDVHRERIETQTIPLLVRATDALTHVARLMPTTYDEDTS